MSRTLLVFKNEIINIVARRSFLLTLFLVPIISYLIIAVITSLQPGQTENPISRVLQPPPKGITVEGYIDQAGLIKSLPSWAGSLRRFNSEAEADQALARQEISAYYILPADYLENGEIIAVRPEISPLAGQSQTGNFDQVIQYNLLAGNQQLAERLHQPINLETHYLAAQPQRDPANAMTFFLPYGVTMLFYMVILGSASLMLNSVTSEKQNRVMEILVTSINPIQLLLGKIAALGLVGLLQTVIWSGSGFLLLRLSGQKLAIPDAFRLPPSILGWGVVFFLLGYAFYGSIMAGVGALVPGLREASQVTTLVVLPLTIPLMLITLLVRQPDGVVAVILSLLPMTAPVTIMLRLSIGPLPLWQILLSAALLLVSSLLLIRLASGLFRAQNLLSGQEFRWKTFLKAVSDKG